MHPHAHLPFDKPPVLAQTSCLPCADKPIRHCVLRRAYLHTTPSGNHAQPHANITIVTIGNPGQPVLVQLDTGSFELWVNPDCTNLPDANAAFCRSVGFYDTTRSSTAANLGTTKTLRYGIGSANITYFTDDIALPGSEPSLPPEPRRLSPVLADLFSLATGLKSVQFGVATSTIDEFSGILGIGYGQGIATRYNNFLDELSAQNAIKAKAFTVALGSKHVQEGIIVFGGVDTSKFSGNLARLPIIPAADSPDQVPRYWIEMKSLQLTPPSGKSYNYQNSSFPVFLDSGATMTLLPSELAAAIAADFGAVDPQSDEFYEVSCDLEQVNGTLDFVFDGATIKVPYDELIRTVQSTPPTCFLGISPSNDFTLLGDSFMRSAYSSFPSTSPGSLLKPALFRRTGQLTCHSHLRPRE